MILLDTDHATFLKYPESERGRRLIGRMEAASLVEVFGVAILTVEERMRGWLAVIARERSPSRQVIGGWQGKRLRYPGLPSRRWLLIPGSRNETPTADVENVGVGPVQEEGVPGPISGRIGGKA